MINDFTSLHTRIYPLLATYLPIHSVAEVIPNAASKSKTFILCTLKAKNILRVKLK